MQMLAVEYLLKAQKDKMHDSYPHHFGQSSGSREKRVSLSPSCIKPLRMPSSEVECQRIPEKKAAAVANMSYGPIPLYFRK
eukprot:6487733-Amphidinium_carterae.1